MKKYLLILLTVLCVGSSVLATPKLPVPQGYVTDLTGLVGAKDKAIMESLSTQLEAKTGIQVATVVIPSLGEDSIEEAAIRIFEQYKMGQKGKDNGILFLIAVKERKDRIEVGYGLEGILNDAKAGDILRDQVNPYLKAGRFSEGVLNGHASLTQVLAKANGVSLSVQTTQVVHPKGKAQEPMGLGGQILIVLGVIAFVFLCWRFPSLPLFLLMSGLGRGSSRSDSDGGGFGGFGGGRSGGGGASGGW
ncbi:MAG: YgcG family protein [Candidatus Margulisiibacteriota bacterium]